MIPDESLSSALHAIGQIADQQNDHGLTNIRAVGVALPQLKQEAQAQLRHIPSSSATMTDCHIYSSPDVSAKATGGSASEQVLVIVCCIQPDAVLDAQVDVSLQKRM